MVLRRLAGVLAGALLLVAGMACAPVRAESLGCILDHCRDRMPMQGAARPAGQAPVAVAPGRFDFYVLALSWSPGFCATHGGRRDAAQCDPQARSGFVVHGLWPQLDRGFPQDCGGGYLPRFALENARGLYPDLGLARHEWTKHGTCTGLSPTAYFAAVRSARALAQVPAMFTPDGRQPAEMSPADVQRAFFSANPRLRPGMMAVGCARGELQEVRVCLSKDLRNFQPCPQVARATCRAGRIDVAPIE